jgi:UDP-N-acetylmuramoylalanine--D-glutamate ligase
VIELRNRRVMVVGLGVSGFAAARALRSAGARVKVTDSSDDASIRDRAAMLRSDDVEVEIGGHDLEALSEYELAVVSPGIPPTAPVIEALRASGVDTIGEVELAFELASCDFLAVTGTNGKTTTTSLLAAMLAEGGIKSVAAGNIGLALIDAVGELGPGGAIALEVSSFQLEATRTFRPRVAVLLNVAEDHTDWHSTFEDYARAKERITANQTSDDTFVYNVEDPVAVGVSERTRARRVPFSATRVPASGTGCDGSQLVHRGEPLLPVADLPVPGRAGIEDIAAAAAAALSYGVEPRAVVRAIKGFRPLPHRLEMVADVEGVRYIDDSKATNPHATLTAVRDLIDVVLIAGGRSKGIDLSVLRDTVPPVRAVVALGEAAGEIEDVFEGIVEVVRAPTMEAAVRAARERSVPGGSVLLSPGCASLDMFENYAARGEAFVRAVRSIIEEGKGDG